MEAESALRDSDSSGASIPLLIRDLNGDTRQVDVPTSANVDDVQKLILGDGPNSSTDNFKLAIGGTDIEPGVPLIDTPVVPAYTYATSLLQVIGNSGLEPGKAAQAVNSVNGVVRQVSSGVTDVNALAAAANRSLDESQATPNDASIFGIGSSNISDFFVPNAGDSTTLPNDWSAGLASPAALVRKLSERMPNHFVPEASEDFVRTSMRTELGPGGLGMGDLGEASSFVPANQGTQPSISDIARVRRQMQQAGANNDGNALLATGHLSGGNLAPSMDISAQSAAAAASGFGKGSSAVVAMSGQKTWMDNVKSTWAVGVVRKSGELQKTAGGLEIMQHLDDIATGNAASDDDAVESMDVDTSNMGNSGQNTLLIQNSTQHSVTTGQQSELLSHSATRQTPDGNNARTTPSGSSISSPSLRRATPIAPSALLPPSGPSPAIPTTSSEAAIQPPEPVLPQPIARHFPIKRGRKLKNPDLTAEQRKQMRKEQKRRSARESRIRKKTMEEGYQNKLKLLINENGTLKKQVTDLTHRLQVLQGLLTVTVRPINSTMPRPQAAPLPGISAGANPLPMQAPFRPPLVNPADFNSLPHMNGMHTGGAQPYPPHTRLHMMPNTQQFVQGNQLPLPILQQPIQQPTLRPDPSSVAQPPLQRSERASLYPIHVPSTNHKRTA